MIMYQPWKLAVISFIYRFTILMVELRDFDMYTKIFLYTLI